MGATNAKWYYNAPTWTDQQTYTIRSRATDMIGNEEQTDAITFTYDTINGQEGSIYVSDLNYNANADYKIYYPNTAEIPHNGYIEIDFADTYRFDHEMVDTDIIISDSGANITAFSNAIDTVNKKITTTITGGNVEVDDLITIEIYNLKIYNPSAAGEYLLPIRLYNNTGDLIEEGAGNITIIAHQYVQENLAYVTSLVPSATTGEITLTLGSGNWNTNTKIQKGCRITGNSGEALLTATPMAQTTITAKVTIDFIDTNVIASDNWQLYCTDISNNQVQLSGGSTPASFIRTLGGTDIERGYSVIQTTDGGYVVTGFSQSYGGTDTDLVLVKFDVNGVEEWTKTLDGTSNSDNGRSVIQTTDGGYVVTGYS